MLLHRKNPIISLIGLFVLFILLSETTLAQTRGVEIRLSGQEMFATKPQEVISTVFEITNSSPEEQEFLPEIILPEGWKLLTPSFPFRLSPYESESKLVSFFIPQIAKAGRYEISYLVTSVRDHSITDLARIFVEVFPVTKFKLDLLDVPEYTLAGESYTARFSVINKSNGEETISVKVHGSPSLPCTVAPEVIRLAPEESKTVSVVVETDKNLKQAFRHYLKLTVQSTEDSSISLQAGSAVEILPKAESEADRFHMIPATVTFSSLFHKGKEKKKVSRGNFRVKVS